MSEIQFPVHSGKQTSVWASLVWVPVSKAISSTHAFQDSGLLALTRPSLKSKILCLHCDAVIRVFSPAADLPNEFFPPQLLEESQCLESVMGLSDPPQLLNEPLITNFLCDLLSVVILDGFYVLPMIRDICSWQHPRTRFAWSSQAFLLIIIYKLHLALDQIYSGLHSQRI